MTPVLLVSGLLGFFVGATVFPSWQVAVETSQVVAGLVHYPAGNPFGIYHVKLWTILHQICAPLLRLGISEILLSKGVSGLLGMGSFQSYALVIYAFSRNAVLAVGATFVLLVSRVAVPGVPYPGDASDIIDTYGVMGLSMFVLVVGLLGAGRYRLGAVIETKDRRWDTAQAIAFDISNRTLFGQSAIDRNTARCGREFAEIWVDLPRGPVTPVISSVRTIQKRRALQVMAEQCDQNDEWDGHAEEQQQNRPHGKSP